MNDRDLNVGDRVILLSPEQSGLQGAKEIEEYYGKTFTIREINGWQAKLYGFDWWFNILALVPIEQSISFDEESFDVTFLLAGDNL